MLPIPIFFVYIFMTLGWYAVFFIPSSTRHILWEHGVNWLLTAFVIPILFVGMVLMREVLKIRNSTAVATLVGMLAPVLGLWVMFAIGIALFERSRGYDAAIKEVAQATVYYLQTTWYVIFPCGMGSALFLARFTSDKPAA